LHDLQLIAVGQAGLGPTLTRNNVAVQFDGDTVGLHAKLPDQRRQGEWGGETALFSVDNQFHII
jgi:hypothetical protein